MPEQQPVTPEFAHLFTKLAEKGVSYGGEAPDLLVLGVDEETGQQHLYSIDGRIHDPLSLELNTPVYLPDGRVYPIGSLLQFQESTAGQQTTVPQGKSRRGFLGLLAGLGAALVYEGGVRQWQDVPKWLQALGQEPEGTPAVAPAVVSGDYGEEGEEDQVIIKLGDPSIHEKTQGQKVTIIRNSLIEGHASDGNHVQMKLNLPENTSGLGAIAVNGRNTRGLPPSAGHFFPVAGMGPSTAKINYGIDRRSDGSCAHWDKGNPIDIFAPEGTPVIAVTSGWIDAQTWAQNGKGGYSAFLRGNDGFYYYYAHMMKDGRKGGQVKAGDVIGYVSNTGDNAQNTPTHLHFGVANSKDFYTGGNISAHKVLVNWGLPINC